MKENHLGPSALLNFLSLHPWGANLPRSATTTPSGSPRTSQQNVSNASEGSTWNPFDDDNFSKLTAEELLNKDFAKLGEGELLRLSCASWLQVSWGWTWMCLCLSCRGICLGKVSTDHLEEDWVGGLQTDFHFCWSTDFFFFFLNADQLWATAGSVQS